MKTPFDFDYDLWTTEDGKRMVRVKATGEESEVSHEVMCLLRAEEKRMRREREESMVPGSDDSGVPQPVARLVSLDLYRDEETKVGETWMEDPFDVEDSVLTAMMEEKFVGTLTEKQRDVYEKCLVGGMKLLEYAKANGLSVGTVGDTKNAIRKKYKNFF